MDAATNGRRDSPPSNIVKHRGEFCRKLLVSPSSLHGVELLEGWSLQRNEQRDCWPCQLVHCILNETMDGLSILSLISLLDRIRSALVRLHFVYCPQPRHGLVPGILGTGKNHFGPEQSHSVYNPWILIRFRKLQLQTSSWNLYFGFSKRRSRARQRRSGSFWFFQRTSVDGWSLVHPQSGDCMNSGPSKTITAVDVAQCIFAKLETLPT